MRTMANEALTFPLKVTLFRKRWYTLVLEYAKQNMPTEQAEQLTNEVLTVLWQQPLAHDPEETETNLLFYVWLRIACHVNPQLQCN